VHLPEDDARGIEGLLRASGFNAVRSSVHVNFWPGRFDKLTACARWCGSSARSARARAVCVRRRRLE
jgi:hypothetical protein